MRQRRRNVLVSYYRVALSIFAAVLLGGAVEAGTYFYVDPDWTGAKSGTQTRPFAVLNESTWHKINAALASGDVAIYFSALKADGVTQQTYAHFLQCRRIYPSSHRLILDGYSFFNSNETTAAWVANPDTRVTDAYLKGKVCKVTGDGSSQGIGWTRVDGNDFVTHNGLVYCCIESHIASSDNEPGVGPNWQLYWDQHGTSGTTWNSGTIYKC
jgi:hypothetical protein